MNLIDLRFQKKWSSLFANQVDPESRLLQKLITRAQGYFNTAPELGVKVWFHRILPIRDYGKFEFKFEYSDVKYIHSTPTRIIPHSLKEKKKSSQKNKISCQE
jgi:hypothetical protein